MIPRIDHTRVVRMFRQIDHIPLIRSYLIAVQHVSCLNILGFHPALKTDLFHSLTSRLSMTRTMTFSLKKKTTRLSVIQSTASTTSTISRWRSGWRSTIFSSSGDLPLTFTKYVIFSLLSPLIYKSCKEKYSLGRVNISLQARQAVQGCHYHGCYFRLNRDC